MIRALLSLALLVTPAAALAEQMVEFGDWQIHYVVFPSSFLAPAVADEYAITRARDVNVVNISVLDEAGKGVAASITGQATNLLGQIGVLDFREVREGTAVYYLAEIRHGNEEVLRFKFAITPPGARTYDLEFQKKLYWDE